MAEERRTIRVLDDVTIDRIAAGEVIERPASIVKELVENSLDSGAQNLNISVAEGGMTSIVIDDDGCGIPFPELPLAFERHATSKIASAADIMQVGSFGFRGEALASIAAVSRCQMVSRAKTEDVGGLIELTGGEIGRREPAPRNQGTTVTVSDLFYNTPARRKFMKSAQAEKKAVLKQITQLALAHPDVRWNLKADGKVLLDLLPVDSLPARARDLLGASVLDHLARFGMEAGGFSVGGLASRPTWVRGNRDQQYIYVNRRPIESRSLSQAIVQAYREVIPGGKHPVVIAFLQLPPGEIDVNVHPAKTEVRLLLERQVFGLLKKALQDGLDLKQATPFATGEETTIGRAGGAPYAQAANEQIARAEADYLRNHFQSGGVSTREPGAADGQANLFSRSNSGNERDLTSATRLSFPDHARPQTAGADRGTDTTEAPIHQAAFWQLHRTYIVTQIRGALVLIDQHNSHERILYNEAKKALEEGAGGIPTQQLLFPANLDLSPVQIQAFHAHQNQLQTLGFTVQPFGGQSIIVQGIPASLKNWKEGQLLLDILDDLAYDNQPSQPAQVDLLASYACHGAVRAGEPLTVPEMQNLVDQLFATDLPLSCPHGRPTLIQLTIEELEKRFGRR